MSIHSNTKVQVLVTGASGFIGKNLIAALHRIETVQVTTYTENDDWDALEASLLQADVVYHLAAVNRSDNEDDFNRNNTGLTQQIVDFLQSNDRSPAIVLPSSTHVEYDSAYGRTKKESENCLIQYAENTGAEVAIYRLPGVFGKWSQPNYNTVVATFCYNIARGLDITISDPERLIELVYIDDVVTEFLRHLEAPHTTGRLRYTVPRSFTTTLGDLAERIKMLHDIRTSLLIPDVSDEFNKCLLATYLSFLSEDNFAYPAKMMSDERGWLFELIKSKQFGQIFVSKTFPGITRGDHYHDTKIEKFCVIQGQGNIRFRQLHSSEILEYPVDGTNIAVVDIPPGYTHSIENTGETEMICLFWANEVFQPDVPDTFWEKVKE